jgi:hypothetical protein
MELQTVEFIIRIYRTENCSLVKGTVTHQKPEEESSRFRNVVCVNEARQQKQLKSTLVLIHT